MRGCIKKILAIVLAIAMVVTLCPQMNITGAFAAEDEPYCISFGRAAYSSSDNGNSTADNVVDGKESTRWESVHGEDIQWLYVDLGKKANITGVNILWEAAYAKSYKIQVSDDEETWNDVYIKGDVSEEGGETEAQDITIKYEFDNNGDINASWTSIDNAQYKVCIGNDQTVAKAPDGYSFNAHGPASGLIDIENNGLEKGKTYTFIVIALNQNTGNEITRGTKEVYIPLDGESVEGETTTVIEETSAVETDDWERISFTAQARYVRIYMTERATNYGYSMFEFQVYGTNGVTQRPVDYGTNLALNKAVACSKLKDEWWMYDDEGNIKEESLKVVLAENAVDGDQESSWESFAGDNQWLSVDLGQQYTIGRIVLKWDEAAGKVYDIDVSADGKTWTTVYRRLNGYPELVDDLPLYATNVRYVRVNGYTKTTNGSGFSIRELEVYEYKNNDDKTVYSISELPQTVIKNAGAATYVSNNIYMEKAYHPSYIDEENISAPIDSNDWWQSSIIKKFGNRMETMPFKTGYSKKGLSILTATEGWVPDYKSTDVNISAVSEETADMYIIPENLDVNSAYDRVHDYSDYSVDLQLCDLNGVVMTSSHIKGSPYIYCDFTNREAFYISVPNLTEYFDNNGNAILASGDSIKTDHLGIFVTDSDNKEGTKTSESFYCITLPANTTVKNSGGKLKITFAGADRYMSVGTMQNKSELNTFYQHGYAFVTDTSVTYSYNDVMSKITSNYDITTEVKRNGFSGTTMQLMLPHQWKYATQEKDKVSVYTSVRGDMHGIWNNHFDTVDTFEGLLPTFAMPKSEDFDVEKLTAYLRTLENATKAINPAADAYWEGKNIHPLAMGVLMADQIGNTELRDVFLKRLKERLVDWFTYDGPDDVSYFVYDKHWGTLYYGQSEFGANWGICDHHFTYGYFLFGATVLATYDDEFYADYRDMIEILIRDYANPAGTDSEYCRFRAYDLYEGHSWAGGYADNDNGNNQESASESLFSWVGMYLWGVLTENDTYRDAAIFGFTNEIEAIKQYWFDYDGINWLEDWPYEVVGQVYGGTNFYGTFFGGQPLYIYGIQWLPISEYLTYYGQNQQRCAVIYQGLLDDTQRAAQIELDAGKIGSLEEYTNADSGWQHITWPFLSQTNPDLAMEKFLSHDTKVQNTDQANTYWFIQSMKELGYKSEDIIAAGDLSASVYYNENTNTYTATVWNPKNASDTVTFISQDGSKTYGSANIDAKALVNFEIDTENNFTLTQVETPIIKSTGMADGKMVENVSGNVSFDDTQIVEISSVEGATIHYTTDGSVPTASSPIYSDKILVSSDTTIKAVAIKEGYINSVYATACFTIKGDIVKSEENIALNKITTASSGTSANAVDGDKGSRWESNSTDDEWFQVDLGSVYAINTVNINWETAYAAKYELQVSEDGTSWNTVATKNGNTGDDTTSFAAVNARYVKMVGISRATDYGYSFYEFEVYGALKADAPTITPESKTYADAQTVSISTTVKGAEIKYSLDGSNPTEASETYTKPFVVSKSTIIKAITYRKGMILSDVTTSEIVISGTISLNTTSEKVAVGRTVKLDAITDKTVTWTSSDDRKATVKDGLVTAKAAGTVTITAAIPNGDKAECLIEVIDAIPITMINISLTSLEMKNLTTNKLSITVSPEDTTDDTTVIWESSDEQVVSVDENGKLTAKSEGEAIITATVGTHKAQCQVTVGPAATLEEMISGQRYNLALGKDVIPSGVQPDGEGTTKDKITDGSFSTAHCAITAKDGAWSEGEPSYVIVDLGAYYKADTIEQIVIAYKNNQSNASVVEHSYSVAFSKDGYEYNTVVDNKKIATAEDLDNTELNATIDNVTATGYVRYVKLSYPSGAQFGMQLKEIAVLDKDCNTETIEITEINNPADFIVKSDNLSEITYTITAAQGQEEFKYNVYVDGTKISDKIDAGTYTVSNISAGIHTVRVVSVDGENVSSGIEKEIEVDDGTYTRLLNDDRNIALGAIVTVDPMDNEHNEGSTDTSILVDGQVSTVSANTVHTTWGGNNKNAIITLRLASIYNASDIEAVLMAFKANNTNASSYNIEFSSNGVNYETVAEITNRVYEATCEDKLDTSKYTQGIVKYVRFNITDGNCTWGYQISEVAVFGSKNIKPISTESVVSVDLGVTGFQMTTTLDGVEDEVGIRTIYQKEQTVEGKKVNKFGLVYGLDNGNITDEDMTIYSNSLFVTHAEATEEGKRDAQMGDSETADYYVMTMPTGIGYNQSYKVRAYAVLEGGIVAYSDIKSYNIFNIAKNLYDNKLMPTGTAHAALYKVLLSVDSSYAEVDYSWNNTLVDKQETTSDEVNIVGYQMSAALNGVEGTLGLRVIYSVDGNAKDSTEVGLVYGLVYNNNGITADSMTLENAYDTTNRYVVSYAATDKGLLSVQMGNSSTANYYARTMNVSNLNMKGYTTTYLVRAYVKNADGSVAYSKVCEYTINNVASLLYNNNLMSTFNGHNALYNDILTKVSPDYNNVEYNWNNTIVGN